MSFAQFSYRESLRDIELCLNGVKSKLYHCGIRSMIARSTIARANETRNWKMYADFASRLIKTALPLYKSENSLARELQTIIYAFDSTTIDLCLQLFPWAKFRRTKSAIKVHVLLNIDGAIPEFISITKGTLQDVNMLDAIQYKPGCFYVVDKAYVDFKRFYRIELQKAFFVTRAKENLAYIVEKERETDKIAGINRDELIVLKWHHGKRKYKGSIRRIEYQDPVSKLELTFLTNNFTISAITVASLYKERWKVELFFKWIKQNLKIKRFYGNSENAVKTQVWIAICDYLLIAILRKQLNTRMTLTQMMQVLSLSLFERCTLTELFQNQETKQISNQSCLF
jgi:transposase